MSLYKVMVDDNFHYMDESQRWELGAFATQEEAVAACKKMVDDWLVANHKPGMTPDELYGQYTSFGDDPYVVAPDGTAHVGFSAFEYARIRAQAMCGGLSMT